MDISVLIVDDDKLVVDKLVEGVNWTQLGIGTVLTAYNIRQAMEILNEVSVDILLSDIEMPQGSGLELLEWVRNKEIPVECIFLSSYAYFAYAQKAINLKSREYMLKPVSNRELEEALRSIVEVISKKREVQAEGQDKGRLFGSGICCRKMGILICWKRHTGMEPVWQRRNITWKLSRHSRIPISERKRIWCCIILSLKI